MHPTKHLAVELEDNENGRRRGLVISGRERDLVDWAPTMPGFIGYCGAQSFREACERAMRMDNGEPGAYGPIPPEHYR